MSLCVAPKPRRALRPRSPCAVTVIGSGLVVYWVWHFSRVHPPVGNGEFFEAATISLIYLLIGILVSLLVIQTREGQQTLARSLEELQRTRDLLVQEEKLGTVGRFASAIAHEIRNPVAMISTPTDSDILLRTTAGSDKAISIDVENRGNAIPQPVADKIFEPFFTTKPRGTGLDLAITRNVARSHGGDLQLTSNEAGKVCFTLTIGMSKTEAMEEVRG